MERGKLSQTETAGRSSVDTHTMLWRSLRFQNVVVAQVWARKLSTSIYCQRLKTIIGWIFNEPCSLPSRVLTRGLTLLTCSLTRPLRFSIHKLLISRLFVHHSRGSLPARTQISPKEVAGQKPGMAYAHLVIGENQRVSKHNVLSSSRCKDHHFGDITWCQRLTARINSVSFCSVSSESNDRELLR
jgi:hypothetical protein